ncbi:hypothetical protein LguiA_022355 [Lonicera macranthoides]
MMRSNEMSQYLPIELLSNILIRLPVRTLLRFTIVSKSWYSLITSPNFITTHQLNNNRTTISNKNQTPLLLMVRHSTPLNQYLCKEHYSVRCDNDTFEESFKLDFPFTNRATGSFNIVGTCNGLVCLSQYETSNTGIVILWNPSLRKSFILPNSRVVCNRRDRLRYCIGFGIDPVTNDYKIVRLAYLRSHGVIPPPRVEVFELSTGSWRNINSGDFPYVTYSDSDTQQAFLNGYVHWVGYNPKYNSNMVDDSFHSLIVSFDMRKETLGVVMAPPCVQKYLDWSMCVTVFGESLSFLHRYVDHCWWLWVMNEYCVVTSWTKKFVIDLGGHVGRPICFRENGDILLERRMSTFSSEAQLVSYDPKSKMIKNLEIHGMAGSFYADTYRESLVLSKDLNEVLQRHKNSGGAVTCLGKSVLSREGNDVNMKRKKKKQK